MKRILLWLRGYFLAGVITLLPFVLTVYFIYVAFIKLDSLLGKHLYIQIPGLGLFIEIILIFLTGVFVKNWVGGKLFKLSEKIIKRMPFINKIYSILKEITSSILGRGKYVFLGVVLIEYPRKGIYSLGFITEDMGNVFGKDDDIKFEDYYAVFIPTTPNPTSGMMVFVRKDEAKVLDISIERAMKLIVSGAMVKEEVE